MSITPTTSLDYLDTLAVLTGGLFAGTALYMTIGQVPALREFGLNEHWKFFPYMYKAAAIPQATLTAITGVAAIAHGTRIEGLPFHRNLWFAAGSTFLAMIPFTLVCIRPTNQKIIEDNKNVKLGDESKISTATKKELLDQWAVLHLIRTVGSVAGFAAMVYGLSRHSSLVLRW